MTRSPRRSTRTYCLSASRTAPSSFGVKAGRRCYVPRIGEKDRVSDTMLTLGVLGMVLGDRALFEQILKRFVNGVKA